MADPKRVRAGKRSREKGKEFERLIARKLREFFADEPWVGQVRRSDQGHRAALSDVTGWPGMWCECENARGSNPRKKLAQAERDILAAHAAALAVPVAVCREYGSPVITATLRLQALTHLAHSPLASTANPPVTMLFDELLVLFEEHRC